MHARFTETQTRKSAAQVAEEGHRPVDAGVLAVPPTVFAEPGDRASIGICGTPLPDPGLQVATREVD